MSLVQLLVHLLETIFKLGDAAFPECSLLPDTVIDNLVKHLATALQCLEKSIAASDLVLEGRLELATVQEAVKKVRKEAKELCLIVQWRPWDIL